MLLALGLNIVVGYAGLLDLGYVAFYGFGAYGYAMLASPKFGLHWSTLAVVPLVVVATAILGFLVALPSRRLLGDYLAIVTLFFGQLFVTVYQNGESMSFLGFTRSYDVTGGPNGIPGIDGWNAFGSSISSLKAYFYAALIVFLVALAAVYLVDVSRTGRAWRSLREDALAAELMGMPVNRLKLVAFAFGAAIAGLAGTLFAALNTAVFAPDFDTPTLIIVYSMLILGGAGSLGGVIVGALTVNVSLEVLRTPDHATWVFYGMIALGLVAKLRPWRWLVAVVAGTVGFGFAVHAIAAAVWARGVHGQPVIGGVFGTGDQELGVDADRADDDRERRLRVPHPLGALADDAEGLDAEGRARPRPVSDRLHVGEQARRRAEHHAPDPRGRDTDRAHERAAAGLLGSARVEIV